MVNVTIQPDLENSSSVIGWCVNHLNYSMVVKGKVLKITAAILTS